MHVLRAFALVAASKALPALGAYCSGEPSRHAQPNMVPLMDAPPQFVRSVKNGHLYMAGSGEDQVPIVHVYGSAYEMGYAHGELMKDKAVPFMDQVWEYLELQAIEAINGTVTWIPPSALKLIADVGLAAALELTYAVTRPFTGSYFYEELKGLSDATGIPESRLRHIHLIGELTKGSCSMFGAHQTATPDGGLLQLRALDWDTDGPFKNFPQLTVYHPAEGEAFVTLGFTAWVGALSGMSSKQMGISEIGVSYPDATFGAESRVGVPFIFLLRDVLQFDQSLEDSRNRITKSRRTCDLILGVGDGEGNDFRGVQYSHSVANFFRWDDMKPEAEWHTQIQDIVYYGMDWLCPGYDRVLARQLQSLHGNLTAELALRHVTPIVQTGNLHIAFYDFPRMLLYVANARRDGASGAKFAYDRAFVKLSAAELFSTKPPGFASSTAITV